MKTNIQKYDVPDLYTLDYLIEKSDEEIESFFKEKPEILKLIPKLLGIRDTRMKKGILEVEDIKGNYNLDFKNIDLGNIDKYIDFIYKSGLIWIFKNGVQKSIRDYAIGVESGMDSNGRKNRSGKMGEMYLEELLKTISKTKNWEMHGQTTSKKIKELYDLDLGDNLKNRRFDGSLYDPTKKKLYLFEINNYSSSGSKIKSTASEFQELHKKLSRTNHEFIYITDGDGWANNQNQLLAALDYIGRVFNYQMIENGYLDKFLD